MDLVGIALGSVVLAFLAGYVGGLLGANKQLAHRLDREEKTRAQTHRRIAACLLAELKDNLSVARGEFRTDLRNDTLVPACLLTQAWELHRVEQDALGNAYEPVRHAYGAAYHANAVRDYILHSLGKTFGKNAQNDMIQLHKNILKQAVLPALYKAIDVLEARNGRPVP